MRKTQSSTTHLFHCNGLSIESDPEVYEPAEDTFLLLETLDVQPCDSILELGTGAGVIALDCARKGARVVCSDINPFAVRLTRRNIERNRTLLKGSIEVRQGDLFHVLQPSERFDVIVFNPPYLPTKSIERVGGWFDVATDGGRDGLRLTRRFLYEVTEHLVKHGHAFFIFSTLSNRPSLETTLKRERLSFEVRARRSFEGEELNVYIVTPAD